MKILLIITGSIAAYKSLDIIRKLKKDGHHVTCVMSKAATRFVTPLAVGSTSENPVYTDLFSLKDEVEMGHIRLSRENDLILVAPASANTIAKMAYGMADDLLTNILLATNKPVYIAPAMNVKMWHHASTQRNIAKLKEDNINILGPDSGELACGETGKGRMLDPEHIIQQLKPALSNTLPLSGKKVIVTAGPTHEPIDPVRFIGNHSSGKQGITIAETLRQHGAEVTLICGPVTEPLPEGIAIIRVQTAEQMLEQCLNQLPADIFISTAAVADYKPETAALQKLKKQENTLTITLTQNPDILHTIATHKQRPKLVIGFAAETENVMEHATQKRTKKQCDWILANDVSDPKNSFGSDTNTVHFITKEKTESWPTMPKQEVAQALAQKILSSI